jgi:hypothetical protein
MFRHITAEYTCTKCGHVRSVISPSLSPFFAIMAAVATIPLWIITLREPWSFPWYYVICIFAGELLLMFGAGFLASFLLMFDSHGTTYCRDCHAPMFFAGRHFDPAGSRIPHWKDILLVIVFIMLNVAVWFAL